jgi:hypothetical protein
MTVSQKQRLQSNSTSVHLCVSTKLLLVSLALTQFTGELTGDAKASVEFMHYEVHVVQRYLVKLVGWNHPQWLNPLDLKGGLDALEKVVEALSKGTCHFVKITQDKVKEWQRHIAAGEKLTPELEPPVPLDNIPLNNILPRAASSQATQADHNPFDNTSSAEVRLPTKDQTTQQASPTALAHTSPSINSSSIPDDLIDPVLWTADNCKYLCFLALHMNPNLFISVCHCSAISNITGRIIRIISDIFTSVHPTISNIFACANTNIFNITACVTPTNTSHSYVISSGVSDDC